MQCGPRLARKLHCRGLEEKHDLFLAAPVILAGRILEPPRPLPLPRLGRGNPVVVER